MNHLLTCQNVTRKGPYWLTEIPDDRRCTATSKRTGQRCGQWAAKGKTVCKWHGAHSTGPTTLQGKQQISEAHTNHGQYSLDLLKQNMLDKLRKALLRQLYRDGVIKIFEQIITPMSYAKFETVRPYLNQFCRDELTVRQLFKILEETT